MIEVIYKEEKQETPGEEMFIEIPRNIRQIGLIHDHYKIYMEDYVYTFLRQISQKKLSGEQGKASLAVLTGETKWWSGSTYLFIQGALLVDGAEMAADHIEFSDEVWTKINEEQKQYFEEQEVVGWFFAQPQIPVQMTELFTKIHLKYFGGEKVLLLMEPVENEEAFFRYENGTMAKQSGYYIYYQKNPLMQAYMMVHTQESEKETVEDEAVKKFRKIIAEKKTEETQEKEGPSVFSYAATACLVIAALTVGVNFYHNYLDLNQDSQKETEVSSTIREEQPLVTTVPTITLTPAVTKQPQPSVTAAAANTDTATDTSTIAEDTQENLYQEEADIRKAKRRELLEGQVTEEQVSKEQGQEETQEEAQGATQEGSQSEKTQEEVQREEPQEEEPQEEAPQEEAAQEEDTREESTQEQDDYEQNIQEEQQEEAASTEVHEKYVICPGDTLYQISMERYGNMEEIQEICRLNQMDPEEIIYPGQVIVLP